MMSYRTISRLYSISDKMLSTRKISTTLMRVTWRKDSDFDLKKTFKDPKVMESGMTEEVREALKREDPFKRTAKIFKNDFRMLGHKFKRFIGFNSELSHDLKAQFFPTHTDVLIIGGGAIGASTAYWLKQRAPNAMHVTVLEKDSRYSEAFKCLSAGGITQQFSLPENVQMSLFGAEFLRNIGKHLAVDNTPSPDVQFQPFGYLVLASDKEAAALKKNSDLQRKLGARNVLLTANEIIDRFPWLNTTDIELGCLSLEYEGWFDSWSLLNAFKRKSINLGAEFIQGTLIGFEFVEQPLITAPSKDGKYEQLNRAIVRLPDGTIQTIKFGLCVLAARAQSGFIGKMARLGEGEGLLSVPLPIEPRKRFVYIMDCPKGPSLESPVVIDPTGAYFRKEGLGTNFISGMPPVMQDEPSIDNLDVDYKFFEEKVRPILSNRVPAFKDLTVKSGVAGLCEYNTMDENGIIGLHPYYHNLILAAGFSGVQHAPAVGRAVMELILDGEYKTIDLSRLSFERMCLGEPLNEENCFGF